jgi:hypothetical protein
MNKIQERSENIVTFQELLKEFAGDSELAPRILLPNDAREKSANKVSTGIK